MRRFLQLGGAVFAVMLLASCAVWQAETLQQHAFATGSDFNGALRVVLEYESLPRCPEGVGSGEQACSEAAVVEVIRSAAVKAKAAVEALELTARTPGASDYSMILAIAAAQNSITALETILLIKDQI